MGILGLIIMFIGLAIAFVGGIWLLILAFKESILWGLGSLFVPFVSLIFAIMFWDKTKTAFLLHLGGAVVMILGAVLGGTGAIMGGIEPMPGAPEGF